MPSRSPVLAPNLAHRLAPTLVVQTVAVGAVLCISAVGCQPSKGSPDGTEAESERTEADQAVSARVTPDPAASEPTEPEPAPPGTAWLADHAVLVQRCDEAAPCKDLLQAAGAQHCAALELAERDGWRLPTRKEVEAMAKTDGLDARAGYHWTATADDVNDSMFWIVDPEGTQPTTIPGDRKPFRIRCVHDG